MATANLSITPTWQKIADPADSFLASSEAYITMEFATTATDTAPVVSGHQVQFWRGQMAINRAILGAGYVWVRLAAGSGAYALVVTK